jgi:ACS family tartrate transporter-like MFS transporter
LPASAGHFLFHHVTCHYYITAGNDDMNPSIEQITLKKISWRIVPFVMFAYFIAFFDRINIGFAALTMNQDWDSLPRYLGWVRACFLLAIF